MKKAFCCMILGWLAVTAGVRADSGTSATGSHWEALYAQFGDWSGGPNLVVNASSLAPYRVLLLAGDLGSGSFYCYQYDVDFGSAFSVGQNQATLDVPASNVPAMNCSPNPPYPNGFTVICNYDGVYVDNEDTDSTEFYYGKLTTKNKSSGFMKTASCVISAGGTQWQSSGATISSRHVVTQAK
jgi:hypothetical protein